MVEKKIRSFAESAVTADYEIQISGALHERWSHWFGDITITVDQQEDHPPLTIFHCPAMDQAKLRGMLNKIWDLNIDLVSVQRLHANAVDERCRGGSRSAPTGTDLNMEDNDV